MGYWGGKFAPYENDLMRGIVAAKSLQSLEAICRLPVGEILKVFHIKSEEKAKQSRNKKYSDTESFEIILLNFI